MRWTMASAAFAALMAAGCASQTAQSDPDSAPASGAPAARAVEQPPPGDIEPMPVLPDPATLPPLPAVSFNPPRPIATVKAIYRYAALHPEVLRYVPCFCGCERNGHRDNEDCFIASRAADGTVSWDAHGLG